jgi:hypothetical protein
MAIPAQGMTITWGGSALQEVSEISIDQERGLPLARAGAWTLDLGTIRIASFSTASLPVSDYGVIRTLSVTCPPSTSGGSLTLFSGPALLQNRRVSVAANDAVRFDHLFKIMD